MSTFVLDDKSLQVTLPAQPNPYAFFVQLTSAAIVAAHISAIGLGPNIFSDLTALSKVDDALLKRLYYAISIAGSKWATAQSQPVGFYAALAVHNTSIDATWDGGSANSPYGSPNTPA